MNNQMDGDHKVACIIVACVVIGVMTFTTFIYKNNVLESMDRRHAHSIGLCAVPSVGNPAFHYEKCK